MSYIMKTAKEFSLLGLSPGEVVSALSNHNQIKVSINRLVSFFTLFPLFLMQRSNTIYKTFNFPISDDIRWFCHRVTIVPAAGSLLSLHGIDGLSFSLPPDRGSTTLEMAFMAGTQLVYLDKYGSTTSYLIPSFDVYDFMDIMEHLIEINSWMEGLERPEEE
jgi:hypothetical protein